MYHRRMHLMAHVSAPDTTLSNAIQLATIAPRADIKVDINRLD